MDDKLVPKQIQGAWLGSREAFNDFVTKECGLSH